MTRAQLWTWYTHARRKQIDEQSITVAITTDVYTHEHYEVVVF